MSVPALANCPFCGSTSEIGVDELNRPMAGCNDCQAQISADTLSVHGRSLESIHARLAEHWNRRAPPHG